MRVLGRPRAVRGAARLAACVATIPDVFVRPCTSRPRGVFVGSAETALPFEPYETCGGGSARATPRARAGGRGVGRRGVGALTVLDVAAGSCASRRQDEASEDTVPPAVAPRGERTEHAGSRSWRHVVRGCP